MPPHHLGAWSNPNHSYTSWSNLGPGSPWKASTTTVFICLLLSFPRFHNICDVFNPAFINPVRLSTTSCQYMTNHNPTIINPVRFDYKSPILYMDNPVSIITRYSFIINRHNMERVISTQDWDYHPHYKKLVKPMMWFNITGLIYFIFDYS